MKQNNALSGTGNRFFDHEVSSGMLRKRGAEVVLTELELTRRPRPADGDVGSKSLKEAGGAAMLCVAERAISLIPAGNSAS